MLGPLGDSDAKAFIILCSASDVGAGDLGRVFADFWLYLAFKPVHGQAKNCECLQVIDDDNQPWGSRRSCERLRRTIFECGPVSGIENPLNRTWKYGGSNHFARCGCGLELLRFVDPKLRRFDCDFEHFVHHLHVTTSDVILAVRFR